MVRDVLTGVYAKSALSERLDEEVHRALRYGEAFSVLLLDADHFKSINDAFGHAHGDAALAELVARVQQCARSSDVLFRYGGDEFVLFLPRTTHEQAVVLGERLVERVSADPFGSAPPLSLAVSVGVASFPRDGTTAAALLDRADGRMYEAKRRGGHAVAASDGPDAAVLLFREDGRLVERADVLDRVNRFLDDLPAARRAVLRLDGPAGVGKSRMLREAESLARLRGHAVVALRATPEGPGEPMAALGAAELPSGAPWGAAPAEVAAWLRNALAARGPAGVLVTVDGAAGMDRASLEVARVLLAASRGGPVVGAAWAAEPGEPELFPAGAPLYERLELRPLTRDGVRVWLRALLRWEAPEELVAWLHAETGGLPAAVRRGLLHLARRRVLVPDGERWTVLPGFRDVPLRTALGEHAAVAMRAFPAAGPPLVGREAVLRELVRLLRTERLVTLVGPGGAGKTRLAVEAAHEAAGGFADGAAWVSLHDSTTPAVLAGMVADVLDLPSTPCGDPVAPLVRHLRSHRLLLVLDGCEHLRGCAGALAALLDGASGVRLLATSRGRLRVPGEWALPLEGLRVSRWRAAGDPTTLPAARLFAERAARAVPHFAPAEAASAVTRLCELVDGVPLSMEVAAAHAGVLPCRDLARELEAGVEEAAAAFPSCSAADRGTGAVLALAWRHLPPEARRALCRASLLRAPFGAAAALAVAEAGPAELEALEAAALVRRDGERWAIPPRVREWAERRLDERSGEREAAEEALAAHYLGVLREAEAELGSRAEGPAAAERLRGELPHLRRAWRLASRGDGVEALEAAAPALFALHERRGSWAEAVEAFTEAVAWTVPARGGDGTAGGVLRARLGAALACTGDVAGARAALEQGRTAARRRGDAAEEAFCLRWLARTHSGSRPVVARRLARRAVEAARACAGDARARHEALRDAGLAAVADGAPREAALLLLESLDPPDPGAERGEAWDALVSVAERLSLQGELPLAATLLSRTVADGEAPPDTLARAARLLGEIQAEGSAPEERGSSLVVLRLAAASVAASLSAAPGPSAPSAAPPAPAPA